MSAAGAVLRMLAFSCLYIYLIFLPYLSMFTDPYNRMMGNSSPAMFGQIHLLIVLLGVGLAMGVGLLHAVTGMLPRRLAPHVRRVALAPLGAFGITTVATLIWNHYPWPYSDAALLEFHHAFKFMWLGLCAALVVIPALARGVERIGRLLLILIAPLPVVLLAHLTQFPALCMTPTAPPFGSGSQGPSAVRVANALDAASATGTADARSPASTTPASEEPGPVYVFVFDEWDRVLGFAPGWEDRYPHLAALCATSTRFERALATHNMTLHSLPSILFQTDAPVHLDANGRTYFGSDSQRRPAAGLPSLFEMLGSPAHSNYVVGRDLWYPEMVGDRTAWIHHLPFDSGHPLGLVEGFRSHLYKAYFHSHFPLHHLFGVQHYPREFQLYANQETHDQTLRIIREAGPATVALFHTLIPHPPFLYERNGVRPDWRTCPESEPADYPGNLAYLDTLIGELVAAIRDAGHWDRCTLVLTSDHGTYRGHSERRLEVPLIIKQPGQHVPHVHADPISITAFAHWLKR